MDALKTRLAELLNDKFGVPVEEATSGATFEDLDVDSLVIVEFFLAIRKEWGVQLSDGDLKASNTLDDAVALVASKGVTV
ncbi:acyl carrier protein [Streptomyces sp. NPDC035033]|uniref:acyl carrier protein n=1 Tax=Streptomyces sp. NPDC035033 TaxID=3155368 RepID=UPI0033EDC1B3